MQSFSSLTRMFGVITSACFIVLSFCASAANAQQPMSMPKPTPTPVMTDMNRSGDVEVARNAFAEIKHCMDQMDMIHRMHMSGMSKEMAAKMKPMMAEMKPKMAADKAAINEHIAGLQNAFQMDTPDAALVQKHAAELVMVLEKMMPPAKKMDMSGKKPM